MLETILNPELWVEGLTTMVVGMGIVFSFLVILVFAILIMARVVAIVNKLCPVAEISPKKTVKANDDAEIAVAVAMCANQK